MSQLLTHTFTVNHTHAPDIRELLVRGRLDGVTFTERSYWLVYRRFGVTAPPWRMELLKREVAAAEGERWWNEQW